MGGDDQGGTRDQGRCHAGTPGDGQRILAATRGPTGHAVRKRIVAEQQQHHAQRNVSEINPHVPFPPVETPDIPQSNRALRYALVLSIAAQECNNRFAAPHFEAGWTVRDDRRPDWRRLSMIARIWRGITLAEKADDYLDYLRETGLRDYAKTRQSRSTCCGACRANIASSCWYPCGNPWMRCARRREPRPLGLLPRRRSISARHGAAGCHYEVVGELSDPAALVAAIVDKSGP